MHRIHHILHYQITRNACLFELLPSLLPLTLLEKKKETLILKKNSIKLYNFFASSASLFVLSYLLCVDPFEFYSKCFFDLKDGRLLLFPCVKSFVLKKDDICGLRDLRSERHPFLAFINGFLDESLWPKWLELVQKLIRVILWGECVEMDGEFEGAGNMGKNTSRAYFQHFIEIIRLFLGNNSKNVEFCEAMFKICKLKTLCE